MNVIELIDLKKNKKLLSEEQINFFIHGVVNKLIPDYQISALLMAIWFNGLDQNELYYLTKAMTNSGKIYSFHPSYKKILIDKHSTGGIGDKVSIALAPILSCFNLGISKLSGRGLGFTGGTIDKLESIGVDTNLSIEEAKKILNSNDMFIIGQTSDIVPADKILYALRDVTGTVDSLPLIAASVLSKKFAFESDYIFIDIKYGQGAFCKDLSTAQKLKDIMIKLAQKFNRKVYFLLSDMNQVLGQAIGNAIEVQEVVDYLKDEDWVSKDFKKTMETLITLILIKSKICKSNSEAKIKIKNVISSKMAFHKFIAWVEAQKGDVKKIENNNFFKPKYEYTIKAQKKGRVSYKSVIDIAQLSVDLGSGRYEKNDKIDYQAGIYLHAKEKDSVKNGDKIISLYSSNPIELELVIRAKNIFKIK
ncbi:thymidine phosphorylase [Mycoplasmoides alvi]|uniref:thymidine phosphorylase n=1 Tax=Mycoplasmoides alvi TaxID=78580 RepID=UPI00051B30EC|nr:thymidine phosphorylase [Mycoplasmoides alvi]